MTSTTPHVGVRTFLNRVEAQPLLIADITTIGGVFEPDATVDRVYFPPDTPVAFYTDDLVALTKVGSAGTLKQTVDAIIAAGIVATVVAVVPAAFAAGADISAKMAVMVGSAAGGTGVYALLRAEAETGIVPDILIAPGYTSQRLGSAANPAATALDAVCERLVTAIAVCDTPSTTKEAAVEWSADFEDTLNIVATAQGARVLGAGGSIIVQPSSPHVAALIAKTDKEEGAPYYNPGNRQLTGILGPSRSVGFSLSDPDCEANYLIQRGVNSIVHLSANRTSRIANGPQGKLFWGFFNTSTDPLWRAINVVRTRKAVREVIPRTLARYAGQNLGAHIGVLMLQSLDGFLSTLKGLPKPAILGGQVRWDRALNDNATLRTGGFAVSLDFEEAPPITDIQVYTGRHSASFNILATEIQTAMAQASVGGQLGAA